MCAVLLKYAFKQIFLFEPQNTCLSLFELQWQKYRNLGGLNNWRLFFSVLETGKAKIKVPVGLLSGENLLSYS